MYLLSRLRSEAESHSYCMISCNPDCDSWLYKWVEWYLDEEGFPDKTKNGIKRYYLTVDDSPVFADSPENLKEQYPDFCKIWNPVDEVFIDIEPKSFTFISGTIFDNPILIKKNPKYLAELNALPKIEKARLLHGNWKMRPEGSSYFDRAWLKKIDSAPLHCTEVRAWDKASTEPSDVNRYPDYTASIKMLKDKDGYYYIKADYIADAKDEKSDIIGRFRKKPGERDILIEKQARADGTDCTVVMAKDPGSAGQVEYEESAKKLIEAGFKVSPDPMPPTKSKLKRFEPFSSAAQNGLVYIIEDSFPNKATLEAFYAEMEAFDGERSGKTRKDDWPDACASAFNALAKEKVIPHFTLNHNSAPTMLKTAMDAVLPIMK